VSSQAAAAADVVRHPIRRSVQETGHAPVHAMTHTTKPVVAVLAVEHQPADPGWRALCQRVGVQASPQYPPIAGLQQQLPSRWPWPTQMLVSGRKAWRPAVDL